MPLASFQHQLTCLHNQWGLQKQQSIQPLWSGYGEIARYHSEKLNKTVIIKQVIPDAKTRHPRGWNTRLSHQRKLFSYQAELNFYRYYAPKTQPLKCHPACRVPALLDFITHGEQMALLLEDIDADGFHLRKTRVDISDIKHCLSWLAAFHGKFLHTEAKGLWDTGCYWHLHTRPDEFSAMADGPLKQRASAIDKQLNNPMFLTLVHGDAKLANFCFQERELAESNNAVVALDFQYVGGGPGIKDVMLFLGSCLDADELFACEQALLKHYFEALQNVTQAHLSAGDFLRLETEWRQLYPLAWADFQRFLAGWKPDHVKINAYMQAQTQRCLSLLDSCS